MTEKKSIINDLYLQARCLMMYVKELKGLNEKGLEKHLDFYANKIIDKTDTIDNITRGLINYE